MKRILQYLLYPSVFFLLCVHGDVRAQPSYGIPRMVFGSGGGVTSGPDFRVKSTVGQAAVGVMLNSFHRSHAGFWYTSGGLVSGVDEQQGKAPGGFLLYQNHPNPFGYSGAGTPVTVIGYVLPRKARVFMTVYDAYGRKVTMRNEGMQGQGYHELELDGAGLPSGLYLITIRAGKNVRSIKALLVR